MKIYFGITEESKKEHKEELEWLDNELKSLGLECKEFGLYEGKDNENFRNALMLAMYFPFISEEGLFFYYYPDEENEEYKEDIIAIRKKHLKILKSMTENQKEYEKLLKEAGI